MKATQRCFSYGFCLRCLSLTKCFQNVTDSCLLKDSTCTKAACTALVIISRCSASNVLTAISLSLVKSPLCLNTHIMTPASAARSAGEWSTILCYAYINDKPKSWLDLVPTRQKTQPVCYTAKVRICLQDFAAVRHVVRSLSCEHT